MPIHYPNITLSAVAVRTDQCPRKQLPEIVMSGRSNVGKSSLINALSGRRQIARVSNTPGKTRQILFFELDQACYLVDLPGYGHAAVAREAQGSFARLTDEYLNSDRPIALILLLLDIRVGPTVQDVQMLRWLESSGHPWRMVLMKSDKLSRSAALQRRREIARSLDLADQEELLVCSARNKDGIEALRAVIEAALAADKAVR